SGGGVAEAIAELGHLRVFADANLVSNITLAGGAAVVAGAGLSDDVTINNGALNGTIGSATAHFNYVARCLGTMQGNGYFGGGGSWSIQVNISDAAAKASGFDGVTTGYHASNGAFGVDGVPKQVYLGDPLTGEIDVSFTFTYGQPFSLTVDV